MAKTGKTINRQVLDVLIPVILENALMSVSSMILTGYLGRLNVLDINAYGLESRVYGIYFGVFAGLSVGVMIEAAKRYGSDDKNGYLRVMRESYLFAFPIAVIVALLILWQRRSIFSLMTSDPELIAHSSRLLARMALFFPFRAVFNICASAFHAHGDTKTPMMVVLVGNVINVVFGYLLIFGIGNFIGLGVNGAAWSQNISLVVMAGMELWLLHGKNGLFRKLGADGEVKNLYDPIEVASIFRLGIPAALEDTLWELATIMVSKVILSYGQQAYAAYLIGLEGEFFCNTMSAGFLTGAMSLASISIGKKDKELYDAYFSSLKKVCYVITVITMASLILFTPQILRLMTDKDDLIRIASGYLYAMVWSQLPVHLQKVYGGFLRSGGLSRTTFVISFSGLWAVRVVLCYVFGMLLKLPIESIWWAFNIDLWYRLIVSAVVFSKKREKFDEGIVG